MMCVLRLREANDELRNDENLERINLDWDSKNLNMFSAGSDNTWDDETYAEERFHVFGSTKDGRKEFKRIIKTWREHIALGWLAAHALCEYMDSRIHCFDNKQTIHPSKKYKKASRIQTTELADWQTEQTKPIVERHTTL